MQHNIRPQKIGIVAGSAEGAALCYRTICARASAIMGPYAHPDIILYGVSLADYMAALERDDLEAVADIMLHSARELLEAGADFLICPDNTMHHAMDLVLPKAPLPWLHIAEVVAEEARRRGFRKPCILGTRWIVESAVYPNALKKFGIDCQRPETEEARRISDMIMNELFHGVQKADSVQFLERLTMRLKSRGCDAIIMGCTELPIVLNDGNSALPTLDSTRLLADAALRYALSESSIAYDRAS